MEIFKYCKMQIGLLLILFYISYLFIRDGNKLNEKTRSIYCNHYFDWLFVLGELCVLFDGVTVYTVNHLKQIPNWLNLGFHLAFFLSYQIFVFIHFLYWLSITDSRPRKTWKKGFLYIPFGVMALTSIVFLPQLQFRIGTITNYSMGVSAVACFVSIGIYSLLTLIVFYIRKNYIQYNKRTGFIMAISAVFVIIMIQMIFNEILISSVAIVLVIVSLYLCMENPSVKYLEFYHDEMVMGFATLVESKDGSTGGHIRRSSAYAVLIANELRKTPQYRNRITKDYIDNLGKAAPMHDVGKIGIPDNILQKPAKLTDEEFEVMKKHPEIGGNIIKRTFGHLDDDDYENMAYKIAMSHHEKWNGNGYPKHLKETEIPLCARIMAVADVFDAVSAKRCYRDALPLDVCYRIISEGRGVDFDPDIVDAFFQERKKVEEIYQTNVGKS